MKIEKTTIYFWLKGQAKQFKQFDNYKQARIFLQALQLNNDCEACGVLRR